MRSDADAHAIASTAAAAGRVAAAQRNAKEPRSARGGGRPSREEEELWEMASGRKRENSSDRSRSDQTGSDGKRRSDGAVARSGQLSGRKVYECD